MEKAQLKNYLQNRFSIDNWIRILRFLVDDRKYLSIHLDPKDRTNELTDQRSKEIFRHIKEIGVLKTSDGADLPIFDVELSTGGGKVNIEYNKVGVNSLLKRVMSNNAYKGLIVTFHYPATGQDEWRFSFISKSSASDFFAEIEAKETNPKKYTYIFGTSEEHRTAIDRLYTLKQSRFRVDDFFDAFNVEPISKGFFNEYKNFYLDFAAIAEEEYYHIFQQSRQQRNDETDKEYKENVKRDARNFVKRLLSRIVFLYFLQKKKWIAASNTKYEDGDTNFLENLFNGNYGSIDKNEFYNAHLAKLFFEALNKPNRKGDFYTLPDDSQKCIPFLNGGLFEEEQEPKEHRDIVFPTYLFEELFRFFSSYNFTIYENSPQDHTIAVDPEMLGHIFENLLEDNKDKGAFYTPKEIVQYMTQESLIQYLYTSLPKVDKSKIEQLVRDHNIEIFGNEIETIKQIDKAIDEVKICDPAIGSGAFPMGLLQEIFSIKALIQYQFGFEVWSAATVKENIIQNSIYGVDVEIGAVDIARLRFWLSLVVDEDRPKPLPNLDYKIMQGDSLISKLNHVPIKIDWNLKKNVGKVDEYVQNLKSSLSDLIKVQKKYFSVQTNKDVLKKQIREKTLDILYNQIYFNRTQYLENNPLVPEAIFGLRPSEVKKNEEIKKQKNIFDQLLLDIDLLRKNENQTLDFFDWEICFPEVLNEQIADKIGFDIVIGNPPYVEAKKLKPISQELKNFEVYSGTADLSIYFVDLGLKLCKDKANLAYITTNKFFTTGYGEKLRSLILDNQILNIINFEQVEVFENVLVSSVILGIKKNSPSIDNKFVFQKYYKLKSKDFKKQFSNTNFDVLTKYNQGDLDEREWSFADKEELVLKQIIEKNSSKLGTDIEGISVYRGVTTGYNPAFIIPDKKRDELIAEDKNNEKVIKNMLQGRNIRKWVYNESDENLLFTKQGIDINLYPSIKEHLKSFYSELKPRENSTSSTEGRKPGSYEWFEIQDNTAYYTEFEKSEKIIWGLTADKWAFAYDDKQHYLPSNGYILTSDIVPIKYILALLNSSLMKYYFTFIGVMTAGGAYTLKHSTIQELPFKVSDQTNIFSNLVDYILYSKTSKEKINEYTTNDALVLMFEETIDAMVYELYFEEHLKDLKLDVIDLVCQSLDRVANLPMNDQINHLFKEWNEYENDLRNRIILQRTRSEYISTIEKALDK